MGYTNVEIRFTVDLPSRFIDIGCPKIISHNTLNMIPTNLFLCEWSDPNTNGCIVNFFRWIRRLDRSTGSREDLQLFNAIRKEVSVFEEVGIHTSGDLWDFLVEKECARGFVFILEYQGEW
jgi:hypothetical protein